MRRNRIRARFFERARAHDTCESLLHTVFFLTGIRWVATGFAREYGCVATVFGRFGVSDDSDVLEALRKRVEVAVFDGATPVRDFPPLARQLHGMLDEDDLAGLRRLRSRVLEVLEAAPVRELAALSRRVQLLTSDIDALQAEVDGEDELTAATSVPDESWNGDPADL